LAIYDAETDYTRTQITARTHLALDFEDYRTNWINDSSMPQHASSCACVMVVDTGSRRACVAFLWLHVDKNKKMTKSSMNTAFFLFFSIRVCAFSFVFDLNWREIFLRHRGSAVFTVVPR